MNSGSRHICCTQFDNMVIFARYCIFGARQKKYMVLWLLISFATAATAACLRFIHSFVWFPQSCHFHLWYDTFPSTNVQIKKNAVLHMFFHSVWRADMCTCVWVRSRDRSYSCSMFATPLMVFFPAFNWIGGGVGSNLFNKLKASYSRRERLIRLLESHRMHAKLWTVFVFEIESEVFKRC